MMIDWWFVNKMARGDWLWRSDEDWMNSRIAASFFIWMSTCVCLLVGWVMDGWELRTAAELEDISSYTRCWERQDSGSGFGVSTVDGIEGGGRRRRRTNNYEDWRTQGEEHGIWHGSDDVKPLLEKIDFWSPIWRERGGGESNRLLPRERDICICMHARR